jgi:hypothetical protein
VARGRARAARSRSTTAGCTRRCTAWRGAGLIAAEWGVTENNRRARYYRVTPAGRAHLRAETATWLRYAETVTGILTDPQPAA